jgi:NTE family protein
MSLTDLLRRGAVMDPAQLHRHIHANVGEHTFAEAFAISGRALNISVSPTRARQKPRVLNHLTTPTVLVWSAAAASCAVPGLFPSASLLARGHDGRVVPYARNERWVDGSMLGDLPKSRVSRLHNVNHFVVSQTNPHVVPFLSNKSQSGLARLGMEVAGSLVRAQTRAVLDLARRRVHSDRLRPALDQAHALAGQEYEGDINIHPRFDALMYRRVLTNVTTEQLEAFALGGAQATWPQMARVRDTTRISRTLDEMVGRLKSGS